MIRRFVVWFACLTCLVSFPWPAQGQSSVPVTIAWDPSSANPEGYAVFIGTQPGAYAEAFDVGPSTQFTYATGKAGQRYYFTVAAYKPKSNVGGKATPISAVIEAPAVATLDPPIVDGSNVTLRWHVNSSSQIVDFVVDAGTASGLSNVFSGSVGLTNEISAAIGGGTFFVRVTPRTVTHVGRPGNEVSFSTDGSGGGGGGGCAAPPQAPAGLSGAVHGGMAAIRWLPVPGAIAYGVQAGSSPGQSDIYQNVIGPTPSLSSPVEPGFAAYVRVYAINGCGVSPPSREVIVR